MSLRDLVKKNPPLRTGSQQGLESECVAMLPGDGEPEDHVLERLAPSTGRISRLVEEARRAHRLAEENPERGAWHQGIPPTPDLGGETQEYTPSLGRLGTMKRKY
jgi:hypothetical protein